MSQERSEAIVLRGVDYSETSRIVTLLSPERGRLACMAKGARRPKSALAGTLDTLNRLEIVYYWKENRSVQQLGEATVLEDFRALKQNLEKGAYSAFPLEIASRVARENEPSKELYATLVAGLQSLAEWPGDVQSHGAWQAWRLLSAAGFEPSLEACIECGNAVEAAPGFAYAGGVTCANCQSDRRLSPEAYKTLLAYSKSATRCPVSETQHEVFGVIAKFAQRQLECDFRSVRVLNEMFN